MSEAVLRVRTEGGAEVQALVDRLDRAITASRSRRVRGAQQAAQQETAHYRQSAAQTSEVATRADRLVTRHRLQQLALTDEARRKSETLYLNMMNRATRALEREVGERGKLSDKEMRQVHQLAQAMVVEHDRAERAKTAATARETERRKRLQREAGAAVTRAVSNVGAAGASLASDLHGRIQDSRQRRAAADRVLGNAVRNSGGSEADVASTQAQVRAFALAHGMQFADVASALEVGQGRGSALEPGAGQLRSQALSEALRTIREANAEAVDPGQLLAARGRLGQAGLSGDALNQAIRYTMRAAQRGSVEVDQIIQQGLPGASSLMTQRAAALTRHAGESDSAFAARQQQVRLAAFQESVAMQEVAASAGKQPGNTANTLASLNNFVRTPRRQEMILQNIRTAESQINTSTPEGRLRAQRLRELYEGDNAVFERDPTRRGNAMRLRDDVDPMQLAVRMTAAAGGNASSAMNLLAGGGQGNPQSLLANQRALLTFIGSELGRVRELQNGGGLSDAQIAAHQRQVENDDLSKLNRNQEANDAALSDNTGALRNLSDAFARFQAQNPIANAALGAAAPVAGGLLAKGAGLVGGRAAVGLVGARAAGLAALGSTGSVGATLAGSVGAASTATVAATVAASALAGLGAGYAINRAMGHNQQSDNPFDSHFYTEFAASVRDAVRDGLHGATVNATISEHDAVHAATNATTRGQRAP